VKFALISEAAVAATDHKRVLERDGRQAGKPGEAEL
jgi:hypothetical protein